MTTVIEWRGDSVRFLDQTKLPETEEYVTTDDPHVVAEAIRTLAIRGAPLIGIAAAYGVVLAMRTQKPEAAVFSSHLEKALQLFASTRPTAVNLFWALDRMREASRRGGSPEETGQRLLEEALLIHEEDRAMCHRIGEAGAAILPNAARALTHCNTGMLATGGRGTALGVIRTAWEQKRLHSVFIGETRPLLQGARLTAWELANLRIPATLITDSTAGFLMKQGKINVVIVGADRIAANGDVANKIGTYGLAVLAKHHGIPFFVAAPSSTVDLSTPSGTLIEIEQRKSSEVTHPGGIAVAPQGTEVYSPAFDITPSDFVTAMITEVGVLRPPFSESLRGLRQSRPRQVGV